ncbi:MAG: hypothetical protein HYR84_03770 [Planctomycetes bacterium]|nr:hypothetical protein [Planctomycetota bacterium]
MLSNQELELLTAFVDGEPSKRQRKAMMRLLHKSSEARDMLRQMQENAHKLKQLPYRKVEPSLVDGILQAIADEKSQPAQPTPVKPGRRVWLPYVAASLAASLLIGVLGLLYHKHMIDADAATKDETPMAKGDEKKADKQPPYVAPTPTPPTPRKPNPLVDHLVNGTFDGFGKPIPVDQAFTARFSEIKDGQKTMQLAKELERDPVVQLDVTVKGNKLAMDRLKDVLRERKITLVADASASKKLGDKNQAKVEYLVYADNMTTDEVTKLMAELSKDYVLPMGKQQKDVPSPYQRVTVTPAAKDAKQKLEKLLGEPNMKLAPNRERQLFSPIRRLATLRRSVPSNASSKRR